MSKGKYTSRHNGKKSLALILALTLMVGGVIGGTLAWLADSSKVVTNTFTTSDISIELKETKSSFQMIPGWTIDKDPKVSVNKDSEDCYLFVKIEGENADIAANTGNNANTYSLGDYVVYALETDWIKLEVEENVFYRVVNKNETTKTFSVLGAGQYTDPMDATKTDDAVTVEWAQDQVAVKPSVTKEKMATANTTAPKLIFTAYAVQENDTNNTQFTPDAAWALAKDLPAKEN